MSTPVIQAGWQSYGQDLFTVTESNPIEALDFDGTDDWVDCGDDAATRITNKMSVSVLAYFGDNGLNEVMAARYEPGIPVRAWSLRTSPSSASDIAVWVRSTSSFSPLKRYETTSHELTAGWHQVGFTFDTGTLKLFIDGAEVLSINKINDDAVNLLHSPAGTSVTLGATNPPAPLLFFEGKICNVAISDTAVWSAAEFAAHWGGGTSPLDPSTMTFSSGANVVASWLWNTSLTYPTIPDNVGSSDGTMTDMTAGDIVDSPWSGVISNTISIADGWYDTPADVATAIETELQALSGWGAANVFSPTTNGEEWEIDSASPTFSLAWDSEDLRSYMGFAGDVSGSGVYVSDGTVGSTWFPHHQAQDVIWRRATQRKAARDHTGYTAAMVYGTHDRLLLSLWIDRAEREVALAVLLRLRSGDRGTFALDQSNANTWAWTNAAWTGVMEIALAPGNQDLAQWTAAPSALLREVGIELVRW